MVPIRCDRSDIAAHYIPAGDLAREAGDEKFSNSVMVGAFLAVRDELDPAYIEQAIRTLVGAKRPDLVEPNLQALDAGRGWLTGHASDSISVTRSTP
ncbi:MAG: hypothetical protein D6744_15310 [Planctomycetota bacterium]|nr:MAG: hypothetical protein D6744_15310 [Planctomycetota bacterium]